MDGRDVQSTDVEHDKPRAGDIAVLAAVVAFFIWILRDSLFGVL